MRWRPVQGIRVKALGLHWREGRLLAAEVPDDRGRVKGVRPPGGGVEFGESARDALRREFREELGLEVEAPGAPLVLENLYHHEGMAGHEVLFLFEVTFPPGAFAGQDRIVFQDGGVTCTARWYALEDLDREDGPALFPAGLKAALSAS